MARRPHNQAVTSLCKDVCRAKELECVEAVKTAAWRQLACQIMGLECASEAETTGSLGVQQPACTAAPGQSAA